MSAPAGGLYRALKSCAEIVANGQRSAYVIPVMSIAEIRELPLAEKLQIMEAIWEDLRSQADQVLVPQWHKDLLDERRRAVEAGREEVLDWDTVKDSLGSRRE